MLHEFDTGANSPLEVEMEYQWVPLSADEMGEDWSIEIDDDPAIYSNIIHEMHEIQSHRPQKYVIPHI
jgi:hypothetical protein